MSYLKLTFLLVLVICATGLVRAWNLGVVTPTKIKFFSNETANTAIDVGLKGMCAVAYDPIKKDIYVSDNSNQRSGSIFRIKTTGKKAYYVAEPIVAYQIPDIHGIAFDHLTSTLFWTALNQKAINYVHVPDNKITVPLVGQILIRFDEEVPQGIAIDVHRGYLYWTNANHLNAIVERSRLDGSGRQVLAHRDSSIPLAAAVDTESNTLYWSDKREGMYYSIQSMDLRENSTGHALVRGTHHVPYAVALDDRRVYWSDWTSNAVWAVSKNSTRGDFTPTLVTRFKSVDTPMGLFALSNVDVSVSSAGSKDVVPPSFKIFTSLVSVLTAIYFCID